MRRKRDEAKGKEIGRRKSFIAVLAGLYPAPPISCLTYDERRQFWRRRRGEIRSVSRGWRAAGAAH